jgi:hypothetical protein
LTELKAPPALIEQVCRLIALRTEASPTKAAIEDEAKAELNIIINAEERAVTEESAEA